jgi:hypothetical protein
MMRGRGEEEAGRGDQGRGRCWRRKRARAEVVRTSGRVAASLGVLVAYTSGKKGGGFGVGTFETDV